MSDVATPPGDGGGEEVVYTAFITLRNGRRLYAYEKGLKAFRLVVRPRKRGGRKKK